MPKLICDICKKEYTISEAQEKLMKKITAAGGYNTCSPKCAMEAIGRT